MVVIYIMFREHFFIVPLGLVSHFPVQPKQRLKWLSFLLSVTLTFDKQTKPFVHKYNAPLTTLALHSSFPVIHKVTNVDIFV